MTDVDRALQEVSRDPNPTIRGLCADALREEGEPELADAVEGDRGEDLIGKANRLSEKTGLHLSVRLLWCAYHVIPRLVAAASEMFPTAHQLPIHQVGYGINPELVPTHTRPGEAPTPDGTPEIWRRLAGVGNYLGPVWVGTDNTWNSSGG